MPIYEYRCEKCGEVFEAIVSLHSNRDIGCRHCGSKDTTKLISAGVSMAPGSEKSAGCSPRGGFS